MNAPLWKKSNGQGQSTQCKKRLMSFLMPIPKIPKEGWKMPSIVTRPVLSLFHIFFVIVSTLHITLSFFAHPERLNMICNQYVTLKRHKSYAKKSQNATGFLFLCDWNKYHQTGSPCHLISINLFQDGFSDPIVHPLIRCVRKCLLSQNKIIIPDQTCQNLTRLISKPKVTGIKV